MFEKSLKDPTVATKAMDAQYQISKTKRKQAEQNWKKANQDYKELPR
ncbi:MAG: hypothetical protein R2769_08310 [Saprospiraceae bacterium]